MNHRDFNNLYNLYLFKNMLYLKISPCNKYCTSLVVDICRFLYFKLQRMIIGIYLFVLQYLLLMFGVKEKGLLPNEYLIQMRILFFFLPKTHATK